MSMEHVRRVAPVGNLVRRRFKLRADNPDRPCVLTDCVDVERVECWSRDKGLGGLNAACRKSYCGPVTRASATEESTTATNSTHSVT
jgi:hypothetical protein